MSEALGRFFFLQRKKIETKASVDQCAPWPVERVSRELSGLRQEFYRCLTRRADALFELADAVLCVDGPVRSVAELSLAGEHRRGHGSGRAALAQGRVDVDRLRTALAGVTLPRT
ncbi:transposase [Lentzea sp. NPDC042327]|uniref:transposase n=1 Tax=Lentzea sp. NPDC042327 TaxID=3154801 RepID=UPI0033CDFCF3